MKLYTRDGDDGSTGLYGGQRVSKHHARVCTYGDVDELNAVLGFCEASDETSDVLGKMIRRIQEDLFSLGAELADPTGRASHYHRMEAQDIARLESWIDNATKETDPLKTFVLPGGSESSARLHLARTVCRRAERGVVMLGEGDSVRGAVVQYLNRLSDLLFAWARLMNHRLGTPDIPWNPQDRNDP